MVIVIVVVIGICIIKIKNNIFNNCKVEKSKDSLEIAKCEWKNGDIYEGEFKDGKFNGNGTYKYKNGNIYEGEFKNVYFYGKGIYKYNNGNIYEGEFKNDNLDR